MGDPQNRRMAEVDEHGGKCLTRERAVRALLVGRWKIPKQVNNSIVSLDVDENPPLVFHLVTTSLKPDTLSIYSSNPYLKVRDRLVQPGGIYGAQNSSERWLRRAVALMLA